ncbi:fumarylacetoacetate hydrolase family protein [bacterium]|nr:fumarylacetoacetate hydrolase family protein [bacterium]
MLSFLYYEEESMEGAEKIAHELKALLGSSDDLRPFLEKEILYPLDSIHFTAPILNPEKIICIGRNYRDHCREQNQPIPSNPIIFSKYNTALTGPYDPVLKPEQTEKLDFEGELAVVIGREGRYIPKEEALEYVAGYSIFHDVTARDIQFADKQWLRGKSFDTFAPMGPFLVTREEVPDPHNLSIKTIVNDRLMQDSNTSNLIFNIPYLINFISSGITLSPGDIIATGTPAGVGVFRDPPIFLRPGDTVRIEIQNLGFILNNIVEGQIE